MAQLVARPAVIAVLGARRVPALVRTGDVAELGAHVLHRALDRAALAEVEALHGLGPQGPLGIGDRAALAVVLDRRHALSAAIAKTGVRNRVEAVRVADERGWL
jgi:hypothetical protein